MQDISAIITAFVILIFVVGLMMRMAIKLRRSGGSIATVVHGANDAMYNRDKKKAAEMVVDQFAGKRLEDQSSTDPPEKDRKSSDID